MLGVDEHVWRHTRKGDKYVTVIIDLTGIRDGTGPSRLLGMVEGRAKQAFTIWLADRPKAWRDAVEVVAMDGFTGFKTATSEEQPEAVAVTDPFHVVRLAGDALDQCRRRVQQQICGHPGRSGGPLYPVRRTLHTGAGLLTDKQTTRLDALFGNDAHVPLEATWRIHQQMISARRVTDRTAGQPTMSTLIDAISSAVPTELTEHVTLGPDPHTRGRRRGLTRPGTSNGPTEAINGQLEHLRGSAPGFRNLARSLLEAGSFRLWLPLRL